MLTTIIVSFIIILLLFFVMTLCCCIRLADLCDDKAEAYFLHKQYESNEEIK